MAARIKLGELLVRAGVLDEFKLKAALAEQQRWGGRLGKILVEMNFVPEDLLVKALSKQLGIPRAQLATASVPQEILAKIDTGFAANNALCPERYLADKKVLYVAMADPTNVAAVDELRFKTGLRIETTLAGELEITQAIDRVFYGRGPIEGLELGRGSDRAAEAYEQARAAMGGYEEYGMLPGPTPPGAPGAPQGPAPGSPPPLPPTLSQLLAQAPGYSQPPMPAAMTQPPAPAGPPPGAPFRPAPPQPPMAMPQPMMPREAPPPAALPQAQPGARPALETALEMAMALEGAQKKQLKALRVMLELLIEKGVFSRDEYVELVNKR